MLAVQETGTIDGGLGPAFMRKVITVFALLILAAIGISLGGKFYGRAIAMGGHTDSRTIRQVIIGSNIVLAPENAIRFAESRRDGISDRLDLYVHWPDLSGYTQGQSAAFNHENGSRQIIFLTFEEQTMSRDMSGRFAPIYDELIDKPGVPEETGLTLYPFSAKSGYLSEELAVASRSEDTPFVARCLTGAAAQESLAPCARDIQIGDNLSLSYRFPRELLRQWPALESAIRIKALSMLKSTRRS